MKKLTAWAAIIAVPPRSPGSTARTCPTRASSSRGSSSPASCSSSSSPSGSTSPSGATTGSDGPTDELGPTWPPRREQQDDAVGEHGQTPAGEHVAGVVHGQHHPRARDEHGDQHRTGDEGRSSAAASDED